MTDDTLPPPDIREHVLAAAIRAADAVMTAHGYDKGLSLQVISVAIDEVMADDESDDDIDTKPRRSN